jgi:formylglycine-generating enzyme required for sulfatase activity
MTLINWAVILGSGAAVLSCLLFLYQLLRRKKIKRDELVAQREAIHLYKEKMLKKGAPVLMKDYREALAKELGTVNLFGLRHFDNIPVKLDEVFVPLRISEAWRSEWRFDPRKRKNRQELARFESGERSFAPAEVMRRAFKKAPLLLIIGDPGSGKTTLLKYYAISCLENRHKQLGLSKHVLPIFLPLRELQFEDSRPILLWENLARRPKTALLNISTRDFRYWIRNRPSLILLDGLDEISDLESRRAACEWIKHISETLPKARFVVTARGTGMRKEDLVELECRHLRADILDFSPQQQEIFLKSWFRSAFLEELPEEGITERAWQAQQTGEAEAKAGEIIDFLNKKENRGIRQLAGIPMLLQIMAIVWKDREYLPGSRFELYDTALDYLLDYRDRRRKIKPPLPVKSSRRVLEPTALWLQLEKRDEAKKNEFHEKAAPILETMKEQLSAEKFCVYLRDRAGLIADYGEDHYIFRHKSFREFLTGAQLLKEGHQEEWLKTLVENFKEPWWEEVLRFFMSSADDKIFDRFMRLFFRSEVSRSLTANQQALLENLVRESPQWKVDGLIDSLEDTGLNHNQIRCALDCLKTMGIPRAIEGIKAADKSSWSQANRSYADEIVAGSLKIVEAAAERQVPVDLFKERPPSFRNPFEDNVEYILIPGGTYTYSVSEKEVTVPDIYFCKYPVTNKRYRRFIAYLAGEEKKLETYLAKELFAEKLREFGKTIKDFFEHSGQDLREWLKAFRSRADDERRFNGPDQPVVEITWYAARAYCFWLSCLDAAQQGDFTNSDVEKIASIYRLPNEWEWQWAAAGREPDGSLRQYPWPKTKGKPTPELANYGKNVGATTPVGRFPEGATPESLMDMAGNVWEWMENWFDEDEDARALRGGSWIDDGDDLRCSARGGGVPLIGYDLVGFRVVRCRLPGLR